MTMTYHNSVRALVICFFIICTLTVRGQTYLGLSAGGGIDGMISLRAAVPVEHTFSKTFSLYSGISFTQQHNAELLLKLDRELDYRRVTLSYLGIPLLIKTRFSMNSFFVYVMAGAQLNYGVGLTTSYLKEGTYGSQKLDFENIGITRWDLGLNTGIGVEREISKECKIFAEFLLLFNFYDIDRDPANEVYNEGKVFNLGFLFPLTK